jgi:hypothetical protein
MISQALPQPGGLDPDTLNKAAQIVASRTAPIAPAPGAAPEAKPEEPQKSIATAPQAQPIAPKPEPEAKPTSAVGPAGGVSAFPSGAPDEESTAEKLKVQQGNKPGIDKLPLAARIPLKVLEVLGSTFAPGATAMIPGTTLHHQIEQIKPLQQQLEGEQAQQKNTADLAKSGAETEREQAAAAKDRADAESPGNAPKEPTTALQLFHQQNPNAPVQDFMKFEQALKDQDKKGEGTVHIQDEKGNYWAYHKDGSVTPVNKPDGTPLQGKTAEPKEGNDFEQYYKQYLAETGQKDSASGRLAAEAKFSAAKQPPQRAPITNVFVPNANGGFTMQAEHAGSSVPAGAVSAAGMNSLNVPTAQTRNMKEAAPKVLDLANRVSTLVDQQTKTLGPLSSRWNEFMAGKVGAPNPEFTKLRTDVALLQTALMRMHVGARGGEQMMEHFTNLLDSSKQSPENLKAALGEISAYAHAVHGDTESMEPSGNQGGGHIINYQGKQFQYKGTGDTADLKNYTEIKK